MNRSCRSQATTQSWLTSTTMESVIIFAPPYVCRVARREIDIGPQFLQIKNLRSMSRTGKPLRLPYERAKGSVPKARSNQHEIHFVDVRNKGRRGYIPRLE